MKRTKAYNCLVSPSIYMALIAIAVHTKIVLAAVDAMNNQGHKVTPAILNEMCRSVLIENRFN